MSNLLKAKRLADGDDYFRWRVEAACWAAGIEFTPAALRRAALNPEVLAKAQLATNGTIASTAVTDEAIIAAIGTKEPTTPTP